jgi:CRISPR-associated protein Cas2
MAQGQAALSGYRLMWMIVMFDLPVGTRKQRKAAAGFRNFLLDQGFEMSQFSVYARFCAGKEQAETYMKRIENALPRYGKVHVLTMTDRQYENGRTFRGRKREHGKGNPEQLALF